MLTIEEIKELLKSREPVLHKSWGISLDRPMIEYAYISAAITRYDPDTKQYKVTLELMDKNKNAVSIVDPKDVYRKDDAGE